MNPLKITADHWLEGVKRLPYPSGPAMPVRRFAIAHFTSGASALSSFEFWKTPDAKGAEAHIIIDRDGTIYQIRPFNQQCDHAGRSQWTSPLDGKMYNWLNQCSIGVEFANAGDGANQDGTAFSSHKFKCPAGVVRLRHKFGGPLTYWETYPPAQIAAGTEVFRAIVKRYNLDDLIGHDDIAPDRKNDPGPAFPMAEIRLACGFTGLPAKC